MFPCLKKSRGAGQSPVWIAAIIFIIFRETPFVRFYFSNVCVSHNIYSATCASQLKQLGTQTILYCDDNDGYIYDCTNLYIANGNWASYLTNYMYKTKDYGKNPLLKCPSFRSSLNPTMANSSGYHSYNANQELNYKRLLRAPQPTRTLLLFDNQNTGIWAINQWTSDPENWLDYRHPEMNILFIDGHTQGFQYPGARELIPIHAWPRIRPLIQWTKD